MGLNSRKCSDGFVCCTCATARPTFRGKSPGPPEWTARCINSLHSSHLVSPAPCGNDSANEPNSNRPKTAVAERRMGWRVQLSNAGLRNKAMADGRVPSLGEADMLCPMFRATTIGILIGLVVASASARRREVRHRRAARRGLQVLAGKRVGLVANPASVDSKLTPTVEVLRARRA